MTDSSRLFVAIASSSVLLACASLRPAHDPQPQGDARAEPPPVSAEVDPAIAMGREATRMLYAGHADALHARFSDPMQAALPTQTWRDAQIKLVHDLGPEVELLDETTSRFLENVVYRRRVTFEKAPGLELVVTWGFGRAGTITGFSITPKQVPADTPHLAYRTKTLLHVPFQGEWEVLWGGRSVEQNYHAATVGQRFALDIVQTGADQRSYTGDGKKNEDYLAFGAPVLAPGSGIVTVVVSDVADNVPGTMNVAQLAGNHVLIDHGSGEYSLLAHFQHQSIVVRQGDRVEAGQLLGKCGNSGNSSEPHIHYHLQDSPVPLEGQGLPIFFKAAIVDGVAVQDVELLQGNRVAPSK